MRLTIRQITEADMDDVMFIERASYKLPCRRRNIAKLVDDQQIVCLVAKSGEVIVATVFLETTGLLTSILGIAVLPDCRRQGIGRALIRMIAERFSGCGVDCYIGAIVPESDRIACAFLEGCGFRFADTIDAAAVNFDEPGVLFRLDVIATALTIDCGPVEGGRAV
jgi:ribosomal protein S18 acetylase RimI-like enzyme